MGKIFKIIPTFALSNAQDALGKHNGKTLN